VYRTTWHVNSKELTPDFVQMLPWVSFFLVLISTEEFTATFSSTETESGGLQTAKAVAWRYIAAAIRVGKV
jgi:hypothetical protein